MPEACDARRIGNDQIHGAGLQSEAKPRDCWLTDLVASCNAALRLAGRDTGAGLFLLVRRLAAEFDALVLSRLRPECLHLVSRFVRPEQE